MEKTKLYIYVREVLSYINRLQVKEGVQGPKLLDLMVQKSQEPGLTAEELAGFNSILTEDYEDFTERYGFFLQEYGIHISYFDGMLGTGEVYLQVVDIEKYLNLLSDIQEYVSDIHTKIGIVRKVDLSFKFQVESIYLNADDYSNAKVIEDFVKNKWGNHFENFMECLRMHNEIDPDPPKENFYARRKISLAKQAYDDGYLKAFMTIYKFLPGEETGEYARMGYLEDISSFPKEKILFSWYSYLDFLKCFISIYDVRAKPVIDKIIACMFVSLKVVKEKALKKPFSDENDNEWLCYKIWLYEAELKRLASLPLKKEEQEIPKEDGLSDSKIKKVTRMIRELGLNKDEIKKLIQEIKPRRFKKTKDFPF